MDQGGQDKKKMIIIQNNNHNVNIAAAMNIRSRVKRMIILNQKNDKQDQSRARGSDNNYKDIHNGSMKLI